jgi:hypothetical protein
LRFCMIYIIPIWYIRGKQWQPTPKNLPSTQCTRAIPVALTGLWFLPKTGPKAEY